MNPLQLLQSLGGVARTAVLLDAGFDRADLAYLSRHVAQPKRGVYAASDCRRDFLAAIMHNAVLTCASAAFHYGLWLRNPPRRDHLGCNHGYLRGAASSWRPTFHRGLRYPAHHTLPLAAVEDVIFHALGCLPESAAIPLATSAIRQHGLRRDLLEDDLLARKCGRALGRLRLVDQRVESLPEAEALLLLVALASELGVEVEPQAFVPGIGRVDFLIAGFLIVEIDGAAYHSDRASVLRDRQRNNASTLQGYLCLRYLPEIIWHESDRFVMEVRTALTGRATR